MTRPYDAAVLGIGSSHGDDSIGWHVVDDLRKQDMAGLLLRELTNPMNIVDYLADANQVHVVDAAIGMDQNVSVRRLAYLSITEQQSIASATSGGTHGLGLVQALQLAESLGLPIDHVTVWLARGEAFDSMADPSATAIESTRRCTKAIVRQLQLASTVAR